MELERWNDARNQLIADHHNFPDKIHPRNIPKISGTHTRFIGELLIHILTITSSLTIEDIFNVRLTYSLFPPADAIVAAVSARIIGERPSIILVKNRRFHVTG